MRNVPRRKVVVALACPRSAAGWCETDDVRATLFVHPAEPFCLRKPPPCSNSSKGQTFRDDRASQWHQDDFLPHFDSFRCHHGIGVNQGKLTTKVALSRSLVLLYVYKKQRKQTARSGKLYNMQGTAPRLPLKKPPPPDAVLHGHRAFADQTDERHLSPDS